jgi:hypothetical protein
LLRKPAFEEKAVQQEKPESLESSGNTTKRALGQ